MLCSLTEQLRAARCNGYAIPALNTVGVEMCRGAVSAAERLRSALIIQTSVRTVRYFGLRGLYRSLSDICADTKAPISLHLDHCKDLELLAACLDQGWTSVMVDAGDRPLEENIDITRQAVKIAARYGAAVEGELGVIGGSEDAIRSAGPQDADIGEVRRYVEETGVDMLALGVGTFHGRGLDPPRIRFELLEMAARESGIPLVLHGGTGIPTGAVRRAIRLGVAKINISTEVKEYAAGAVSTALQAATFEPLEALERIEQAVADLAAEKIAEFGSVNRIAWTE